MGVELIPVLATSTLAALATFTNPSCSQYTLYYSDQAELASTTSAFLSSMVLCPTITPSISASTTSTMAPSGGGIDPCEFSSDSSNVRNGGFECFSYSGWSNAWDSVYIITTPDAHGGSNVAVMNDPGGLSPSYLSQALDISADYQVYLTFWVRLKDANQVLNGCYWSASLDSADYQIFYTASNPSFQTPTSTGWTSYTITSTAGANQIFLQFSAGCAIPPVLYIDDVTISAVA